MSKWMLFGFNSSNLSTIKLKREDVKGSVSRDLKLKSYLKASMENKEINKERKRKGSYLNEHSCNTFTKAFDVKIN